MSNTKEERSQLTVSALADVTFALIHFVQTAQRAVEEPKVKADEFVWTEDLTLMQTVAVVAVVSRAQKNNGRDRNEV